ncbi:MAG: hypothetical protein CL767_06600 [Chloroflexi bacterium]|nr:hypothetical protein [Chloroflexota bacterium]MQG11578.1 hypothetical protein [SAR202 cluster bacterium]|tara:strand:+ start:1610 stop:1855 length:246 start_codon:yes stop_codon:yes gene_type:complete
MPINEVDIISLCGECGTEIETVTVKKDNMMLVTSELAHCSKCQADCPQVRDVAGRLESIEKEQQSYPVSVPAELYPDQASA